MRSDDGGYGIVCFKRRTFVVCVTLLQRLWIGRDSQVNLKGTAPPWRVGTIDVTGSSREQPVWQSLNCEAETVDATASLSCDLSFLCVRLFCPKSRPHAQVYLDDQNDGQFVDQLY